MLQNPLGGSRRNILYTYDTGCWMPERITQPGTVYYIRLGLPLQRATGLTVSSQSVEPQLLCTKPGHFLGWHRRATSHGLSYSALGICSLNSLTTESLVANVFEPVRTALQSAERETERECPSWLFWVRSSMHAYRLLMIPPSSMALLIFK